MIKLLDLHSLATGIQVKRWRLLFGVIPLSCLLFSGCGGTTLSKDVTASQARPEPITIIVGCDKTASVTRTLVPQVTWPDLDGLIGVLRIAGGELFVLFIGPKFDGAAIPMIRIVAPPVRPHEPELRGDNIFERQTKTDRHRSELTEFQSRQQHWDEDVQRGTNDLHKRLQTLLESAPTASRTDIVGFLRQAANIAQEPGKPAHRNVFVILVSDGEHDAGGSTALPRFRPGVSILLVNHTGDEGILSELAPAHFASLGAAKLFIESQLKGEK